MRLGIGTYCYMWSLGVPGAMPARPMTALELLEEAVRLRVGVVQFGPNHPLEQRSADELARLLAFADAQNLELELGARGLQAAQLAVTVRFARACGAELVRTVPAELPQGGTPEPAEMERQLRALLPVLEGESVSLAIENALIPARTLRAVLETIGHPRLGITLDTVNSMAIGEGVRDVAEVLAPWTLCLHVKDFAVSREWHMMGFRVEGAPAGSGLLDVPWLLETLRRAGRDPNAILELWPPAQQTVEETVRLERRWVRESIHSLRKLITE